MLFLLKLDESLSLKPGDSQCDRTHEIWADMHKAEPPQPKPGCEGAGGEAQRA
jgi:hypothetical protein